MGTLNISRTWRRRVSLVIILVIVMGGQRGTPLVVGGVRTDVHLTRKIIRWTWVKIGLPSLLTWGMTLLFKHCGTLEIAMSP
jgi:hypothetical protein